MESDVKKNMKPNLWIALIPTSAVNPREQKTFDKEKEIVLYHPAPQDWSSVKFQDTKAFTDHHYRPL